MTANEDPAASMNDISGAYDLLTRWEIHVNSVACDCIFSRHQLRCWLSWDISLCAVAQKLV